MGGGFPWITVGQVAELLGVTEGRIRQMVKAGQIRPVAGGPIQLFSRSAMEALAAERGRPVAKRGSRATTGRVALLPAIDTPAVLTSDTTWHWSTRYGDVRRHPIHIRTYLRADGWTIVLLAEPVGSTGSRHLMNHIEPIWADIVASHLAGQRIDRTVIIEVWPESGGSLDEDGQTQLHQVVLEKDKDNWVHPTFEFLGLDDLGAAVGGAHVDMWDWPYYTIETITKWQRTRRPVEVEHDPHGIRGIVEAIQRVRAVADTRSAIAERALLTHLRLWLSGPQLREPGPPAGVNTSRRIPYVVPESFRHDADSSEPPETLEECRSDMEALRAWRDEVDDFSDTPNHGLHTALKTALVAAGQMAILVDAEGAYASDWLYEAPDAVRITLEILDENDWANRYFQMITWDSGWNPPDPTRVDRILAEDVNVGRYGKDLDGNRVAELVDPTGRFHDLRIWWPTTTNTTTPEGIEPGLHLVADVHADAAYLARQTGSRLELVGLLPRRRSAGWTSGWGYGYSGSGPAELARATGSWIKTVTGEDPTDQLGHWINGAPEDEPLDLDLSPLIPPTVKLRVVREA